MRAKVIVLSGLAVALGFLMVSAAYADQDATVSGEVPLYQFPPDYAVASPTGNVAEVDVRAVGTGLQYGGLLLNVGAGVTNIFLKAQAQTATGKFSHAACYLGNNGAGFGLGFFALTEGFTTARMRGERQGSSVILKFTNVDGGTKADQTYTCTGAPAPEGTMIGVHGYDASNPVPLDNFRDGVGTLDTFSYSGALASSGNWQDINLGMVANGSVAQGGPLARSVWISPVCDLNGDGRFTVADALAYFGLCRSGGGAGCIAKTLKFFLGCRS